MAAPIVLAIDTCGATGTLAVARFEQNATVIVAEAEIAGRAFASLLVSRISEILNQSATQLEDLAAIAVVHGPGSFTGVRIGVATAKALAEASSKPLIAISRLAVLCGQAKCEEFCCALLDAGREEFYGGIYRHTEHSDGGIPECIQEQLMTREQVMAASEEAALVTAEPAVAAAFPYSRIISVRMPSAIDAVQLVAARLQLESFDDAATLDGNYLRRTDAELFARPQPRALPARPR